MGSAVFALRPPGNTSLDAYADPRMCRIGGGTAEALRQFISNALLPKERKAH